MHKTIYTTRLIYSIYYDESYNISSIYPSHQARYMYVGDTVITV